jgi:hypothetical protein
MLHWEEIRILAMGMLDQFIPRWLERLCTSMAIKLEQIRCPLILAGKGDNYCER